MESETRAISSSLWDMRIDVTPCFFSSRSRSRSLLLSSSFRAAVGSSRMSSFTFLARALAISTSCCLPTPMFMMREFGILFEPHLRQELARQGDGPMPIDHSALGPLVAEEDVLRNGEIRDQGEFLVDDDDPELFAIENALESAFRAFVVNGARIVPVRVNPTQDLHQRGLAGAVLAYESVDFVAAHFQADPSRAFTPVKVFVMLHISRIVSNMSPPSKNVPEQPRTRGSWRVPVSEAFLSPCRIGLGFPDFTSRAEPQCSSRYR